MTNPFADFANERLVLAIGTNMTEAHPVASTFVKNAVANGAKLYVVDPRKTPLARLAKKHFPIKVGSDIAFLNGLMNVLITEDIYDKEYVQRCCKGFDELKAKVLEYTPERAAEISGIPAEDIRQLARDLAAVKPGALMYTLGITEHTCGVNNVLSTANLQMLLGNVGFTGGGVNPLRGQNNVQGACDMGALPNVYPGYQKVDLEASQEYFKKAWGMEKVSPKVGSMMPNMLDGLVTGAIKAFYIFGENLVNSEPDIKHMEHCLASAEFLVCQDIFLNETTPFAHVVLPAAAWSEKDGTFTNSERRVNRVRAVSTPPGLAKQDWQIFKELAERWGVFWESNSAQELWDNEISVFAPNLRGIKYERIEKDGLQWPCPTLDHPGTPTLHRDGKFTSGIGCFKPVDWTPPAEVPDAEYPFVLSTGRRLYHYHTRTQTGRAKGLNDLMGEETADISPADAEELGIKNGEIICVRSRRGKVNIRAKVTDEVPRGMIWMTFHFRETNANWLTNPVFDPISKTAEYKACSAAIEKIRKGSKAPRKKVSAV